jgi:hypothetical protein
MGMFREAGPQEMDIVKEMAESLGSAGLRLEEILEKTNAALVHVQQLLDMVRVESIGSFEPDFAVINESIRGYNALVDKAQNALDWVLIQREACGFRTHRNVHYYYPIPAKIKLLKP